MCKIAVAKKPRGRAQKILRENSQSKDISKEAGVRNESEGNVSANPEIQGEVSRKSLTELSDDRKRIMKELERLDRIQKNLTKRSGEIIALYENIGSNCERLGGERIDKGQRKKSPLEKTSNIMQESCGKKGSKGYAKEILLCMNQSSSRGTTNTKELDGKWKPKKVRENVPAHNKQADIEKSEKGGKSSHPKEAMQASSNERSRKGKMYNKKDRYTENIQKKTWKTYDRKGKGGHNAYNDSKVKTVTSESTSDSKGMSHAKNVDKDKERRNLHRDQIGAKKSKHHRNQEGKVREDTKTRKEKQTWKEKHDRTKEQKTGKKNEDKELNKSSMAKSAITARELEKKPKHSKRASHVDTRRMKRQNPCYRFVEGNKERENPKKEEEKKEAKPNRLREKSPEEVITPAKQRGLQYREVSKVR